MNATSVKIMWDPPVDFNGIFKYYEVVVNEIEKNSTQPYQIIHNLGKVLVYNFTYCTWL